MTEGGGRHLNCPTRLEWLDPLRAFALLGVLLNHLVEEFGRGPWFTNPGANWPSLSERLNTFFPLDDAIWVAVPRFMGWLGDAGPGVFIFASGLGLAFALGSARNGGPEGRIDLAAFFSRRLLRLYPAYWAAHLLIAAIALALPVAAVNLGSISGLLSLLGVRGSSGLFFHINPSWWFVWTILQLYLLFPLLVWLQARVTPLQFLLLTLAVTVAARGYGLAFLDNPYYWLTGLCGLSRLAEFALGMWAARWLLAHSGRLPDRIATPRGALTFGTSVYLLGLACSFFYWSTLVSNLIVTAGLSLLFCGLWQAVAQSSKRGAMGLAWLGASSYGIYLIHQPLLKWSVQLTRPYNADLLAALVVIAACVPLGFWIERGSRQAVGWTLSETLSSRIFAHAVAIAALLSVAILDPLLPAWVGRARLGMEMTLVASVLLLALHSAARWNRPPRATDWLLWWALLTAAIAAWIAPPGAADLSLIVAMPAAMLAWAACRPLGVRWAPLAGVALLTLAGAAALELALRRWQPLEGPLAWGELPALQIHPTRGFSLKPATVTTLKYNNYSYVTSTDSRGLNGIHFSPERPTPDTLRLLLIGNAFTMPEGVDWDRGYAAILQERLSNCLAPRIVQIINAGVTGYSPTEKLPALKELSQLYRPNIVIDQFFQTELSWMMESREARLRGIGLVAAPGSRVHQLWHRLQLPLHWQHLRSTFVEALTGKPARWRYGKALLPYYQVGSSQLYDETVAQKLRSYYRSVKEQAEESGALPHVIFVPGAVEVIPPEALRYFPKGERLDKSNGYDLSRPRDFHAAAVASSQIPLLSLSHAMIAAASHQPYFPDSWHWTEAGHQVAAAAIIDFLIQRGQLPERCKFRPLP
jgi:peptidoglycan/LPS O-acetylase OafA/YrhL